MLIMDSFTNRLILLFCVRLLNGECRGIYADAAPWIALDVCINRLDKDGFRSMTTSCTENGTAILISKFASIDCEGIVVNETTQKFDALNSELQCDGPICEHAVIRHFDDDTDCDPFGYYTDFPFPVNQCFIVPEMADDYGSIEFQCNDSGVFTRSYMESDDCSGGRYREWIAWDPAGECNDDSQWTQFIKCEAIHIRIPLQTFIALSSLQIFVL